MLLNLLKPKNVGYKKIRLGPPEDGGYVMPEVILDNCDALVSYGIGHNWTYEDQFNTKYNKPVYMFDHTLGNENWTRGKIYFYNEGLGFENMCKDFIDHYNELQISGSVFLKIDIEGAEYNYFLNTNVEKIAEVVIGISLEIHWIDGPENRDMFIKMMDKLNPYFTLCHVHGNNWGGLWECEGFQIPKVFELSFINKKLVEKEEEDNQKYPIEGLDIPNNPNHPDYELTYISN